MVFVHVRGEVDCDSGEDPGPDLEFEDMAQAFASLAHDTQRCVLSAQGVSLPLANMLWSPDGRIEGGVVLFPNGAECMLTWDAVEKNASTMGDLLRIREEARTLLVETAVRKGERERTREELFDLHRLLRPGDIVSYNGPVAVKCLVRVGDDVMGNKIKKLTEVKYFTPPVNNRIITHMFVCMAKDVAGCGEDTGKETTIGFSAYHASPE
jgi:hypothetical protein